MKHQPRRPPVTIQAAVFAVNCTKNRPETDFLCKAGFSGGGKFLISVSPANCGKSILVKRMPMATA